MTFDLGIEGGTVVTPEGRARLNLYVRDGAVAALTSDREPASESVDAAGLLVLPGMVDTHVHLMDPSATEREDFPTGTAAAARAGVTTIVEHAHGGPIRTPEDLREKRRYLRDRSCVDFGLAAHAWPDRIDQVDGLWRAGVTFLKVFTCTTHGVPGFDAAHLLRLFRATADAAEPLRLQSLGRQESLEQPQRCTPCEQPDQRLQDRPEFDRVVGADGERRHEEIINRCGHHQAAGERVSQPNAILNLKAPDRQRQSTEPARQAGEQSRNKALDDKPVFLHFQAWMTGGLERLTN